MATKYKKTRNAYLNCEKYMFSGCGRWRIPELKPETADFEDTVPLGFNLAIRAKRPEDTLCHFYLDDYQFARVWDNPDRYLRILRNFRVVLQPDFSLYDDFPPAVNLFNHYRKQWLGAYWQLFGVRVIPTICWAEPESYEYCFEGVPRHATVSISTVGGFKNEKTKEGWMDGYRKCLEVLQPEHILLFGEKHPGIDFDGKLTVIQNRIIATLKEKEKKPNGS